MAVKLTWVAACGLLLGVSALSARLQASPPSVHLPELNGTQLAACPLCARDIAIAEANSAMGLHAQYPAKRGGWLPAHFRVCGPCRPQLDPAAEQRALQGWVAAEINRLRAEEREGRVPRGWFDDRCLRLRQARLVSVAPDL